MSQETFVTTKLPANMFHASFVSKKAEDDLSTYNHPVSQLPKKAQQIVEQLNIDPNRLSEQTLGYLRAICDCQDPVKLKELVSSINTHAENLQKEMCKANLNVPTSAHTMRPGAAG